MRERQRQRQGQRDKKILDHRSFVLICAYFYSFVKKICFQSRCIWNIELIFPREVISILFVSWDIIYLETDEFNQPTVRYIWQMKC